MDGIGAAYAVPYVCTSLLHILPSQKTDVSVPTNTYVLIVVVWENHTHFITAELGVWRELVTDCNNLGGLRSTHGDIEV